MRSIPGMLGQLILLEINESCYACSTNTIQLILLEINEYFESFVIKRNHLESNLKGSAPLLLNV